MKRYGRFLLLLVLAGCATPQGSPLPTLEITAPFDAAAAKLLLADGTNIVKGNAFMRQQGGGVVTCAGQTVHLIPATPYASQRAMALYNSTERGMNSRRKFRFIPDPPEYYTTVRTSRCDSQGNFVFERVADGDFYVNTRVAWQVASTQQGGQLMHRVSVRGGQTVSLVIAP